MWEKLTQNVDIQLYGGVNAPHYSPNETTKKGLIKHLCNHLIVSFYNYKKNIHTHTYVYICSYVCIYKYITPS